MPDGFGRFILTIKATEEGEQKMDLEKRLEIQRNEVMAECEMKIAVASE